MSRAQCDHCGHVWSTTSSPNDTEGQWLSEKQVEWVDFLFTGQILEGGSLTEWIMRHGVSADRCPQCHQMTVTGEPELAVEESEAAIGAGGEWKLIGYDLVLGQEGEEEV